MKAAAATTEAIRADLPIPFVMQQFGYNPVEIDGGRIKYNNPWRDDHNASLDIFTNDQGVQRAGDYAIGFQGSVIDLIGFEMETTNFTEIMVKARELYSLFISEGFDGPVLDESAGLREMDPQIVDYVMSPRLDPNKWDGIDELLSRPGIEGAKWIKQFKLHVNQDRLIIPYPDGQAIRVRHSDGSKTFVPGSQVGLYHRPGIELHPEDKTPILLVEGESDTWAAESTVGKDFLVVGIPGVGQQSRPYLPLFEGRDVTICFDGDVPGRLGAMRWARDLGDNGCTVANVALPDGRDVCTVDPLVFREAVENRRAATPDTSGIDSDERGMGTWKPGRKDEPPEFVHISNWSLRPTRVLEIEDNTAYEVEVIVNNKTLHRRYVLTASDMTSPAKVHKWASQFDGGWITGGVMHQRLHTHIASQAAFLPVDKATSRPGLYGNTFSWPGGYIGTQPVLCVPDTRFPLSRPEAFNINTKKYPAHSGPRTLRKLLAMHNDEVMQPILAWHAMAPLRSKYNQAPPLFVTGRAGSGKTTIANETERFSGVAFSTNLTSTTQYALTMTMGGTNAFVTRYDEYRPGAARATMSMMNQLIRDAYNGAPSYRGGMTEDKSAVTEIATFNPLMVVGEDFADEQSHRDRIVKVFVPRDGKGKLPAWKDYDSFLAFDYLSWLVTRYRGEELSPVEAPPVVTGAKYEDSGITNRQAYNLGYLDAGWSLLQAYVEERDPDRPLPDANWDHLMAVSLEEADGDPVMDSIRFLFERDGNSRAVFVKDSSVFINSSLVMGELNKAHVALPFASPRALTNYLVRDMGGMQTRARPPISYASTPGDSRVRYVQLDNPWEEEVV